MRATVLLFGCAVAAVLVVTFGLDRGGFFAWVAVGLAIALAVLAFAALLFIVFYATRSPAGRIALRLVLPYPSASEGDRRKMLARAVDALNRCDERTRLLSDVRRLCEAVEKALEAPTDDNILGAVAERYRCIFRSGAPVDS